MRERVDDLLRSEYPASLFDVGVAYDARVTEPMASVHGAKRLRSRERQLSKNDPERVWENQSVVRAKMT